MDKQLLKDTLYDPSFEHDNCGIGSVVNIKGVKTRYVVESALHIVENLEHRAGKDAKGETGDGVGILSQIPHQYFVNQLDFDLPDEREYGVGMFFFPIDELKRNQAKKLFEFLVEKEGLHFIGWRKVPVDYSTIGQKAIDCAPSIWQCFISKDDELDQGLPFERKLYMVRRQFEQSNDNTYVCSFSSRTIVYKGMFLVKQLRKFYLDLQSDEFISAIAIVHSRFSTNTMPSWQRAHPNRFLCHNGEINTIKGNANNMLSREENMYTPYLDDEKVYPVVDVSGSDSAMLDNTLEFFTMSGMELPRAVMMLIPEPWQNNPSMPQNKKDFYEYSACLMEPWDGPASIIFSDGDCMGAVLDRNGLRPSRYYITDDDYLILSSEVGAIDIDPSKVVVKERLRPGRMLLVDTIKGELIDDDELKNDYTSKKPYGQWLESNLLKLHDIHIPNIAVKKLKGEKLVKNQKTHGYSYEDVYQYIVPLALTGNEPVIAMGADAPLAVLSKKPQPLFNYFKQLFAQVTNPPIDAIREEIVTSTCIYMGKDGNILEDSPDNCKLLKIENPILTNTDLLKIKSIKEPGFQSATIDMTYLKNSSLDKAITRLCRQADKAFMHGARILILSDRNIDENHVPIPSLLALSAVNQHLVDTRKRNSVALIMECGEPREIHHFATLLGYGASAINNYLVQDTIGELVEEGVIEKDYYAAVNDYNEGIIHGITKIASKMGISTIQSYRGSQNFEAIGIASEVISQYFKNTISRIEGITMKDIENDADARHDQAFDSLGLNQDYTLDSLGAHKYRSNKEEHLYNPQTIHLLQLATRKSDYQLFKRYSALIDEESEPKTLRGLLKFNHVNQPVDLSEVESVESIVTRFKTGAMSYGSISKEAHECMAIAMNRIHGKSNSGEGGEDAERFIVDEFGNDRCSAIKQVASGRFGVTSEYLNSAKEIQIKMAQGAKPGEGGQLPAGKVYPWIAKTRHSTPGVALISPPPHHDIYSIEDLAQLIYDLKNANKQARISVKLVSEAGVGTVAAGVVKAGAQVVLISGYDGGTGAAPKNSVYNAGLPWELGLAEAHQTLILNGLRDKVIIETDGKLMTGKDVAIAALLGAEEYGFATAPLVTMGCVMMRVCNLDTCPMGVATQNPELRKRFIGKPEYVVNFMYYIAQELREYMAELGFKTIDEMIGRTDCLTLKDEYANTKVDFSKILSRPFVMEQNVHFDPSQAFDFELEKTKDQTVLEKYFTNKLEPQTIKLNVSNVDRSFGTQFGSVITKQYGLQIADDIFTVEAIGSGGQSFGAFIPKGLTLKLSGDSNDYLGKGLSGGKIIVKPDERATFKAEDNIIIGNVALYGATSGQMYASGIAGERFAVRNSGATAVVEGVGDHGCEYMTGGVVVILGKTGRNFAAGMSGGVAYVYDPDNTLYSRLNRSLVSFEEVSNKYDIHDLKQLIENHYRYTKSNIAKEILSDFSMNAHHFKKVIPHDYARMTTLIKKYEETGISHEQAQIEAFYEVKRG